MVDAEVASPERRDRRSKSKVLNSFPTPSGAGPLEDGPSLPIRTKRTKSSRTTNADQIFSTQAKHDDDVVMVDAGGPSETPRRSESIAKKAGLGGMFGGLLSKARPDTKRHATEDDAARALRHEQRRMRRSATDPNEPREVDPDVTMSGAAADEDQEARRAARRAKRAEREAVEKAADEARRAKDEERRERRRKHEEEAEGRRQEEKDARRAARREAKAREDEEREPGGSKEAERAERRKSRRAERDGPQTDGEGFADESRPSKSDRRKSHMDTPGDDEERRRRHEERRAKRGVETPKASRRKSAPIVDSYFDPRNGGKLRDAEYLPADGPVYKHSSRKGRKEGWPHSGTDSWVKDHSEAPPPPEGEIIDVELVEDPVADENERRRLRKTRRHPKDEGGAEDPDERRRRRESKRRDTIRSSEGSQGDAIRPSRRDSAYVDNSRAPSAAGGLFSRFKKMTGV